VEAQGVGSQILLGIQAKGKYYHNISLGFTTKARGLEKCGPKVQPRSHIHNLGSVGKHEEMSPHTPKWVPTLGVGIPMDFQIFLKWFKGSKLIELKISLYYWNCLGT